MIFLYFFPDPDKSTNNFSTKMLFKAVLVPLQTLSIPRPIFDPQQTVMFCVLRIGFCLAIVVCVYLPVVNMRK